MPALNFLTVAVYHRQPSLLCRCYLYSCQVIETSPSHGHMVCRSVINSNQLAATSEIVKRFKFTVTVSCLSLPYGTTLITWPPGRSAIGRLVRQLVLAAEIRWMSCCVMQRAEAHLFVRFVTARCYAERGYEIACRLSVCLSVCNDQVPWLHSLEYFKNNFTAE